MTQAPGTQINQIPTRSLTNMDTDKVYPKRSRLSSLVIGAGLLLSTSISLTLSIDLFASAGTTDTYQYLYGGIALVLELMKLSLVPEIVKRYRDRDDSSMLACVGLFAVLAVVSVMGSVGALQRDNQTFESNRVQAVENREADQMLLSSVLAEIQQNNEAIDYYQGEERIRNYAEPLKLRNAELRSEATVIRDRLNQLEQPEQTTMIALAGTIATVFGFSQDSAQAITIILAAVLLELATAFFFYQATESKGNRRKRKVADKSTLSLMTDALKTRLEQASVVKNNATENATDIATEKAAHTASTEPEATDHNATEARSIISDTSTKVLPGNVIELHPAIEDEEYIAIKNAIAKGGSTSKRAIMKQFSIGADKVNQYFQVMEQEGVIFQGDNGRYKRATG